MKLWSKWAIALAVGVAFVAVPAAQAATIQPAPHSHAKTVLVKKRHIKPAKTHKKVVVKHAIKKAPGKTSRKVVASAKHTKGKSGVKWHHPQLHNA